MSYPGGVEAQIRDLEAALKEGDKPLGPEVDKIRLITLEALLAQRPTVLGAIE